MIPRTVLAWLAIACTILAPATISDPARAAGVQSAPELAVPHGRPSIWDGVDLALYTIELAHPPDDGVVLKGLSVTRLPSSHADADVLVRLHAECSAVDGLTSEEVRAHLIKRLRWELGVRSCKASYDLTPAERAAGVSVPVLALELDLPQVLFEHPVRSESQEDVQTVLRAAAASGSVRLGGVDIAACEDRYVVRPQDPDRAFPIGNLRAYVRVLEATPRVAGVGALQLWRGGGEPVSRRWRWELEVLEATGGR